MKKSVFWKTVLLAATLLAGAVPRAETLDLTTEDMPPWNMRENGKIVGSVTDRIREMLRRAKVSGKIDMFPWKRAYSLALLKDNVCVFATTRTPEREALFKWVGPVGATEWTMYGNAERNIKLNHIDDARPYIIGTYLGDVRDDYFRAKGFKVESVTNDLLNAKKLLQNHIDLWAAGLANGSVMIAQNGWTGKIVPVLSFNKVELYLACNQGVPSALIDQLNGVLDEMNKDGTASALDSKYARWPLP